MMLSLLRIGLILVAAALAAAINRQVRFPAVPWFPANDSISVDPKKQQEAMVDLAGFRKMVEESNEGQAVAIIDAREAHEFQEGHVAARVIFNVPEKEAINHIERLRLVDGYRIAVYCSSAQCDAAEKVFDLLSGAGFTDLKLFHDGWKGWTDVKPALPTATGGESLPEELSVMGAGPATTDTQAESPDGDEGASDSAAQTPKEGG